MLSAVVSAYVEAYDALVSGSVAEYMSLSGKIGGDVKKHVCTATTAVTQSLTFTSEHFT